jgi:hypothetical protein
VSAAQSIVVPSVSPIELHVALKDIEMSSDARARHLFVCTTVAFELGRPVRVSIGNVSLELDSRIVQVLDQPRSACSRCAGPLRGLILEVLPGAALQQLFRLLHRAEQSTSDLA